MTQLLTCIFGALPGPFMMFVGGEMGIESLLPRIAEFKRSSEYHSGDAHWWTEENTPDQIFAVTYRGKKPSSGRSMLVNPSETDVECELPGWMREPKLETLVGNVSIAGTKVLLKAHSAAVLSHQEE